MPQYCARDTVFVRPYWTDGMVESGGPVTALQIISQGEHSAIGSEVFRLAPDEYRYSSLTEYGRATLDLFRRFACQSEQQTPQWYEFRAYNSPTIYGFGTYQEATRFERVLNAGKKKNLYVAYEIDQETAAELDLDNNTEAIGLEDALRDE